VKKGVGPRANLADRDSPLCGQEWDWVEERKGKPKGWGNEGVLRIHQRKKIKKEKNSNKKTRGIGGRLIWGGEGILSRI